MEGKEVPDTAVGGDIGNPRQDIHPAAALASRNIHQGDEQHSRRCRDDIKKEERMQPIAAQQDAGNGWGYE